MANLYNKNDIPEHLMSYFDPFEIGLESTPDEFAEEMVKVFSEVHRVLRDDGTLWLNLGDSYTSGNRGTWRSGVSQNKGQEVLNDATHRPKQPDGMKPKDLVGIPWMVAFALRKSGWYLRQDIIWHKPNPMPESVTDRCTKAHEYIFLFSKSQRYYYDSEAIKEDSVKGNSGSRFDTGKTGHLKPSVSTKEREDASTRNKRSVWTVPTQGFKGAHFACFPPKLIEPCILAGCPEKCCSVCGAPSCDCGASTKPGIVLDPFAGSGTTAMVAQRNGRDWIMCEANEDYIEMIRKRTSQRSLF